MRWAPWFLLCVPWLGCADDADLTRGGSAATALDASLDAARPRKPREDARVEAGPPTLDGAPAASCEDALEPPSGCSEADPTEPNDERAPAVLTTRDTCALVIAHAADKDEDAYRFRTVKSDPVSIELAYRDARRADLSFSVYSDDKLVLRRDSVRREDSELESTIFMSHLDTSYDVRVEGSNIGPCVPYALRVDPSWCSDAYEDNDDSNKASQLDLSHGAVELEASGSKYEADYYAFAPAKADPVLVSGSYQVDATSNLQIRRVLSNITGLNALDDPGARVGTSESWQHWLRSDTPRYIVQIAPSGDGCAHYRLRVDPGACSDAFEDNDSDRAASPIAFGADIDASAFLGDDDFYALPVANGGHCSLRYQGELPLRIDVYSKAAGVIASASGAAGLTKVSWTGVATLLDVRAQAAACQSYALHCEATTSPQ
jgi:hypothetical protein